MKIEHKREASTKPRRGSTMCDIKSLFSFPVHNLALTVTKSHLEPAHLAREVKRDQFEALIQHSSSQASVHVQKDSLPLRLWALYTSEHPGSVS
jgi:hypothetical protein